MADRIDRVIPSLTTTVNGYLIKFKGAIVGNNVVFRASIERESYTDVLPSYTMEDENIISLIFDAIEWTFKFRKDEDNTGTSGHSLGSFLRHR